MNTKKETMKIVSWLGMKRFAGALMYVLREVCGMSEDLLLCSVSVKDGLFIMSEILYLAISGKVILVWESLLLKVVIYAGESVRHGGDSNAI